MPFYTVTAPADSLTAEQKSALAKAITRIHVEATGAPESFVHVTYLNLNSEDWYVGGEPTQQVQVDARIRAGRTDEAKQRLLQNVSRACAEITGLDVDLIGAGVTDIPSKFLIEGGRIAPDPGQEAEWREDAGASEMV